VLKKNEEFLFANKQRKRQKKIKIKIRNQKTLVCEQTRKAIRKKKKGNFVSQQK
jgi:hypothetical protein